MQPYKHITYSLSGRTVYITLNRPEKRNALNHDFLTGLKTAFSDAENDNRCRAVVLKAEGDAFSAGADLEYLQKIAGNSHEENLLDSVHLMELYRQIYMHPKFVIAQVEGPALAGGCGLVTVCDFCFAVPDAAFGFPEVKIGFIPALVSVFLVRKIGEAAAGKMLLTGETMDAAAAKSAGLVSEILEKKQISGGVEEFVEKLCTSASGESVARTKTLLSRIQDMSLSDALAYAAEMNARMRATNDFKRGVQAFLNKEKIKW